MAAKKKQKFTINTRIFILGLIIALIAILAAVLIFTFASVIRKANNSAEVFLQSYCRNRFS